MNEAFPQITHFLQKAISRRRAVIVSSYGTGAPRGKKLGCPGYSYDFVVQLFAPLVEQWGDLTAVRREEIDDAVAAARSGGLEPIHLSFLPLQDVRLAREAPNIVVPAWEFPDIPDHPFDGNSQNNWVETASRCDLLIVGGQFTVDAFRRAGVRTPMRVVPVPTPDAYFQVSARRGHAAMAPSLAGYTFSNPRPSDGVSEEMLPSAARNALTTASIRSSFSTAARLAWRAIASWALPDRIQALMYAAVKKTHCAVRGQKSALAHLVPGLPPRQPLDLSGVVYTSIFNPRDYRKNWEDLLTGFLIAMKDRADATLVLKLVTNQPEAIQRIMTFYRRTGIAHDCKVVFLCDFLSEEQLVELAAATTYYITTTRAEGNCLPLMNYLAAGRPGLSPCHTAIADYFGPDVGFVVESHPEPAAFPHDRRLRKTTTWHRLVWPSLVESLEKSYVIAKHDRPAYRRLARQARDKMLGWCQNQAVEPLLHEALASVSGVSEKRPEAEKPRAVFLPNVSLRMSG